MQTRNLLLPAVALALASLACASLDSGSSDGTLFRDDFSSSSSGWDTGSDDTGSIQYVAGEYAIIISEADWFYWGNADKNFKDIRIEVTARDLGEATDPTFGIMCHYRDTDNYYYLGIGSDGYYAIVRYADGNGTVLTGDSDEWILSEDIPLNAGTYQLAAECAHGRLALYVDSKLIAAVNDSTFTEGDIGLFAETFEQPNTEIHFDDLSVTAVPASP